MCLFVNAGYTVALWVNFTNVTDRQSHVYMSNGGHSQSSHGVALIYDGGNLEMRFRDTGGREWTARSDNVHPGRWYCDVHIDLFPCRNYSCFFCFFMDVVFWIM